jgi:hypothetical protein
MALSNAERQARWRERRAAKLEVVEGDWALFTKAASVFVRAFKVEGKSSLAARSPAVVGLLAHKLERLINLWPDLPLETKKRLAAAKDHHETGRLLLQAAEDIDE